MKRPPDDIIWMARALEQARTAASRGEVPVGAVLVRGRQLLAEGYNLTITRKDPTAHAEVIVLQRGAELFADWRLLDTTLYVTLEPCAMCAGALVLARVPRVVYATADPKAGMVGSLGNLLDDHRLNHRASVRAGVLAEPASRLLKAFFKERRA